MRWCSGSSTLLTNRDFWKSNLSVIQKICYVSGMLFHTSAAMVIFVNHLSGPLLVWVSPNLVLWFNCVFAGPSIVYTTIILRLWSHQKYNFNVSFVFTIQQYAYFTAIKDHIFRTTALWVPSGDNNAHVGRKKAPNNKYRSMRMLCAVWSWGASAALFAGVAYRIVQGWRWYNFLPFSSSIVSTSLLLTNSYFALGEIAFLRSDVLLDWGPLASHIELYSVPRTSAP